MSNIYNRIEHKFYNLYEVLSILWLKVLSNINWIFSMVMCHIHWLKVQSCINWNPLIWLDSLPIKSLHLFLCLYLNKSHHHIVKHILDPFPLIYFWSCCVRIFIVVANIKITIILRLSVLLIMKLVLMKNQLY